MRARAAVLRAKDGPYVIEDVRLAAPGTGELLVRISGAGICHTDLLPRVPDYPAMPPIVAGHEGSGVVEEIGPSVTGLEPGDHVVLTFDSCRACENCYAGHPAYCDTFLVRNLTGVGLGDSAPMQDADGKQISARWFGQSSFASHSIVAARNVVKVDSSLPLEILGPLGCGMQTGAASVLIALGVTAGTSIAVYGTGAVGLSAVMAARVAGAAKIIAVDVSPKRLELAAELGATHTIDGSTDDVVRQIRGITGSGTQFALDSTGVPAVIVNAITALRQTGTCGLLGVVKGDLILPASVLALGRNVKGILEGDAVPQVFLPKLIDLWQQGRFPFDRLVETFPLERINEAEQAALAGEVVKPVLLPNG
ncbi:NAD(P)-dependent alcohol dehydrogenase [Fodinicola feengrottensis]|uniref:NAD(P)-dependent alcohol dehydrogenase n=1 Tax=Fodinicola feengrottensis TaxID=435914 RepID=A0ABN2J9X2_9ACTN|nr:NAD(P)-dependent alcohol dehydrogenase [Fodinicola feengrottensis]